MSRRQIAVHRRPPQPKRQQYAPNSFRSPEWDCFAKYPIINTFKRYSSQFDNLWHILRNYYTAAQRPAGPGRTQLCPILGMGLFRKIVDNSLTSTQFIIIQHIFAPAFGSSYAN